MSFNLCYSWPSIHSTGCFISVFTFCRHFGITRSVDSTTDAAPNYLAFPLLHSTPCLAKVRLERMEAFGIWVGSNRLDLGEYYALQAIRTVRSVTQRPWREKMHYMLSISGADCLLHMCLSLHVCLSSTIYKQINVLCSVYANKSVIPVFSYTLNTDGLEV
jgi:hypothetical protein